jgi:hypothetical protein
VTTGLLPLQPVSCYNCRFRDQIGCSSRCLFHNSPTVKEGMDLLLDNILLTGFVGLISDSGRQTRDCIMVLLKLIVGSSNCPGFARWSAARVHVLPQWINTGRKDSMRYRSQARFGYVCRYSCHGCPIVLSWVRLSWCPFVTTCYNGRLADIQDSLRGHRPSHSADWTDMHQLMDFDGFVHRALWATGQGPWLARARLKLGGKTSFRFTPPAAH